MEDVWLMIRIFLIVLAWGGLLLLAGYGLEMASRAFGRRPTAGAGAPAAAPDDTSGKPASP
jgi:hypothetical protein